MSKRFLDDRRGVSTVVSHTLAIGITSILILGLLFAANTYLTDQETMVTEDALETVGNRLASELSQVDRLSSRRANVTLWATHQERIAGASYDVRIAHGSECDTNTISAENCLVVSSAELDVERRIPIQNDSKLTINQTSPGRFRLTALERGTRSNRASLAASDTYVESNMRVGIGRNVKRDDIGDARELQNIPPTNLSVRIDPQTSSEYPQNGKPIDFIVEAEDVDGKIDTYSIEWGDGTAQFSRDLDPNVTTLEDGLPSHQYANAGVYGLTLTATDDDGDSATITEPINVSGLQLNSLTRSDTSPGYTITVHLTNTHDQPIKVESLYLNPDDPSTTTILDDNDPELGIDTNPSANFEREYSAYSFPQGTSIPATGLFTGTVLDGGTNPGSLPNVAPNSDVTIQFRGIRSDGDDKYDIGINYLLDDKVVTSRFPDKGANAGPTASISGHFTTDPDPPATFQFSSTASDPDGSITNYKWYFGDGTTDSGSSLTDPTHTYSSTGVYTATLVVTDDSGATYKTTKTVFVSPDANDILRFDKGSQQPDKYSDGRLDFRLENIGSKEVTIEDVDVDVTSSSDPVSISRVGGADILISEDYGYGYYDGSYTVGDKQELDDYATIDGGDTSNVYLLYFKDSGGDRVSIDDETIAFTVHFSDGTQETYTFDT